LSTSEASKEEEESHDSLMERTLGSFLFHSKGKVLLNLKMFLIINIFDNVEHLFISIGKCYVIV
jgi:hypothetical protein